VITLRLIRRLRTAVVIGAVLVLSGAVGTALVNWWMIHRTRPAIIQDLAHLPANDVGLVLGSSRNLPGGWSNPFFEGRIKTAARLFREGKVRHLLVSGDNSKKSYDEPTWMRDALVARGVPLDAITLDYAGFRTFDSMARASTVFGLHRLTIITDDFHQPRAVFLAQALGLEAIGFPSEHVRFRWSKKTRVREVPSRVKAWLDVYVLPTKPKFYGPPVTIRLAAQPPR
jgi:SanA protein